MAPCYIIVVGIKVSDEYSAYIFTIKATLTVNVNVPYSSQQSG